MRRVLAAAVVLAFGGVACGDDGGGDTSEHEQEYVDAAVSSIEGSDFPFDDEAAECLAGGMVSAFGGAEAFEEAGIEPEDLESDDFDPAEAGLEVDEDSARELTATFQECDISMAELLVAGAEDDGTELSDDLRECLEENVDEDAFAEVMARAIVDPNLFENDPPEEFTALFLQLGADCPELVEISG